MQHLCRRAAIHLLTAVTLVAVAPAVRAHGVVERAPDLAPVEARLFVADNEDGSVIVVDLPAADEPLRLATPPLIMSIGYPAYGRYAFVLRGRDTDKDFVTVIDTGFEADGKARTPFIARTFTAGRGPGGSDQGRLLNIDGRPAMFMDDDGQVVVFGTQDFGGLGEIPLRRYQLAPGRDHIHLVETDDHLYVGFLIKGFVQIIDKETGEEVRRLEKSCPLFYGAARDETSGRAFFSCNRYVLVVGTRGDEMHQEIGRIPYPGRVRIGPFLHGRDRVLWGYTESEQAELQRLDAAKEPYVIEALPVEPSLQQMTSPDGEYLLVYARSGILEIRDGGTGELIRQVRVAREFDQPYHEDADQARLPDIRFLGDRAYVTLPHEGRIAEVDVPSGELKRHIEVGGRPTRMVAVAGATAAAPQARH